MEPNVSSDRIVYRDDQYLIISLIAKEPNDGLDIQSDQGDYVLWDKEYGSTIAIIKNTEGGTYSGTILSHVSMPYTEYSSLSSAAGDLAGQMESYLDTCFGTDEEE
jgi:hypothetical protein